MRKRIIAWVMSVAMLASTCMPAAAEAVSPKTIFKNEVTSTCHDHDCEDELCEEEHFHCEDEHCEENHEAVKVAVFDTGITDPEIEVAQAVSFVEDQEITNNHGNNMAEVLTTYAPEAEIYDVRVLNNDGEGTYSDIAEAIDWAIENDIDVITMSFAGKTNSTILEEAIEKAEENSILVIAAAGNTNEEAVTFPAAYETVVSVGALKEDLTFADYSNFGDYVDTYAYEAKFEGTSASTQQVAATAINELSEAYTMEQVREFLTCESNKPAIAKATESVDGVVYAAATCKAHYPTSTPIVTKAATCTSTGTGYYPCYSCGANMAPATIPKTSHTYSSATISKKATCISTGLNIYTCTGCKIVKKVVTPVDKTAHTYSSPTITKKATCISTGTKIYTCTGCKTVKKVTIPATAHVYTSTVKNPTCKLEGYTLMECKNCSHSYKTNLKEALGHSYGSYKTIAMPTCTKPGTKIRTCNRCGCKETATITKLSHIYIAEVVAPTCTKTGYTLKKCKNCSYSYKSKTLEKVVITNTAQNTYIFNCNGDYTEQKAFLYEGKYPSSFVIKSNYDWEISGEDWIHVVVLDSNYKEVAKGNCVKGEAGKKYTIAIYLDSYKGREIVKKRTGILTINSAGYFKEINIEQGSEYVLSSDYSYEDLDSDLKSAILPEDKEYFMGIKDTGGIICKESTLDGASIYYAVETLVQKRETVKVNYVFFKKSADYDSDDHEYEIEFKVLDISGFTLRSNYYNPLTKITTYDSDIISTRPSTKALTKITTDDSVITLRVNDIEVDTEDTISDDSQELYDTYMHYLNIAIKVIDIGSFFCGNVISMSNDIKIKKIAAVLAADVAGENFAERCACYVMDKYWVYSDQEDTYMLANNGNELTFTTSRARSVFCNKDNYFRLDYSISNKTSHVIDMYVDICSDSSGQIYNWSKQIKF